VRRLLAYLVLALALAGAGPAAYAHSLSHLGEAPHSEHQLDGDEHESGHACELCAAFSGVGALGTAPALPAVALSSAAAPTKQPHHRLIPCEALARFASRAPPVSPL
jgi:hypothetical protein